MALNPYGIKATQVTESTAVTTGPTRLLGVYALNGTEGNAFFDLLNGDINGDALISFDMLVAQAITLPIPQPGISFPDGIYASFPGDFASGGSVTLIYQEDK